MSSPPSFILISACASLSRGRRTGSDGDVPLPAVIRPCIVPFCLVVPPFSPPGIPRSIFTRLQTPPSPAFLRPKEQFPASRPSSWSRGCDGAASWNRSAKGASIEPATTPPHKGRVPSLVASTLDPFSERGPQGRMQGQACSSPRETLIFESCWFPLAGEALVRVGMPRHQAIPRRPCPQRKHSPLLNTTGAS